MRELVEEYKNGSTLHHAYLLLGDVRAMLMPLTDFFERELNISVKGNPDVYIREFEQFTVDDSRTISALARNKTIEGGKQLFILSFLFITQEAQNALLKLLEEPTKNTHFFLITTSEENVLETVRSRTHLIVCKEKVSTDKNLARSFLKSMPAERITLLTDIIEKKDKEAAIIFLNSLESQLHKNMVEVDTTIFEVIRKSRSYLHDRGASVKMLLENISVIIPTKI